jgi:RNA polymerase sigma factor (sigma-70 family)
MIHVPVDSLLEKLWTGDPTAVESVFTTFEPYLRMVVRKKLPTRLRAKFDSIDVVQSVWADALRGFRENRWQFSDEAHLRAFLVKLIHNRFIDHIRRHRTAAAREQSLSDMVVDAEPASPLPTASEVVQADELSRRMLTLCTPAHREIVRLRMGGLSVSEIAAKFGMHVGSVHRIFHALACRVATEHGSRTSTPTGN